VSGIFTRLADLLLTNDMDTALRLLDKAVTKVVVTDPEDSTRGGEFDNLFSIPVGIDVAHHEVHEGDSYSLFVQEVGISDTETIEILIETPAVADPQKRVHLIASHEGSVAHIFTIEQAATYSSGGTAATAINRQFGSIKTTALQSAYTGITSGNIVTGGTPATKWSELLGAGRTNGGGNRGTDEFVLAPNTEYLFQLTSAGGAGSACNAWIGLVWYEHTDSL
jgi:hypothetical protein